MKIHYDKDITKSYHVTELHYTNTIELDGVQLIPITELEKIKTEIDTLYEVYEPYFKERLVIKSDVMQIIDNHISELKGSD